MPDQPKDPLDPKSFILPERKIIEPAKPAKPEVQVPEQKSGLPGSSGLAGTGDPRTFEKAPAPTAPVPPAPATPPPAPTTSVKALETYSSDISTVIQEGGVSTLSIAAAESARRGSSGVDEQPQAPAEPRRWLRWTLIALGIVLVLGALGVLATFILPPAAQPVATEPQSPFISTDTAAVVTLPSQTNREVLMTNLETAREQVTLSLGLVEWLYVALPTTTNATPEMAPAQTLLGMLAPNIPQDLLRTIEPVYLLGVHSFDENQSFLLLRVDSYQQAYSGLLAWEQTMPQELAPLFNRHPSPHLPGDAQPASTSPQLIKTGFVDRVVENHDARVLQNDAGDILLLWTFLDRNTVAITTNEFTLREIIRRLNSAPILPQP